MAKPKGFADHAKAAKEAHDCGDHDAAYHHIGKMFGLNRKAKKGASMELAEEVEEAIPATQKGSIRGNFAKLRGKSA